MNNVSISYKEKVFMFYVYNKKKFVLKTWKIHIIQGMIWNTTILMDLAQQKPALYIGCTHVGKILVY